MDNFEQRQQLVNEIAQDIQEKYNEEFKSVTYGEKKYIPLPEFTINYLYGEILRYDLEATRDPEAKWKKVEQLYTEAKTEYEIAHAAEGKRFDVSEEATVFVLEYLFNKLIDTKMFWKYPETARSADSTLKDYFKNIKLVGNTSNSIKR